MAKGEDSQSMLEGGAERSDGMPAMPSTKIPDTARIERYIAAGVEQAGSLNPKAQAFMSAVQPLIVYACRGIIFVAPWYKYGMQTAYAYYKVLPMDVLQMVFGVCLCFFGGTFVASIAAIEAFRQMGWQTVLANWTVVSEQAKLVGEANEKDDAVDDDGDGVADVDQITSTELAQRKLKLYVTTVKDPAKLQIALGALWTAYLAVLATLRLEFARTTALALGIVEMVKFPITRMASPIVAGALGAEMCHWTRTIIEVALTFVAVALAWFLQMIISAFYSGLRGGRMFADGAIDFLVSKDLIGKVPFIAKPFNPNESVFDEALGYSVAALGFSFQLFQGFALPFPLNLVFLPLTILEWFLRLQISMEKKY